MTVLRAGLIQMGLKGNTDMSPEQIRDKMLEAHIPLIEPAGRRACRCCASRRSSRSRTSVRARTRSGIAATEKIPDGHTTQLMREYAKKHAMVMVVPIYEEEMTGVYYNAAAVIDADGKYLGKYRKSHLPQVAGFWEKFFFKPGNLGYPMFQTAYCKLGVYICYDRHFPEGWRALALNGAEYVVNPVRYRGGLEPVHLGDRATRRGRGQRLLRRCDQPRRHRGALEHRQVLRLELFRQSARQDRRAGERRTRMSCWWPSSTWTWCARCAICGSSSATAGRKVTAPLSGLALSGQRRSTAIDNAIRRGRLAEEEYARNFADSHPPLTHNQALVESDRCYFCYRRALYPGVSDADRHPQLHPQDRHRQPQGRGARHPQAEHHGCGLRARVSDRGVVRGRVRAQSAGAQAGDDRRAAAPRHRLRCSIAASSCSSARPSTGKRIAVVGGGPAGLSCAHRLAMLGHRVTVFEARAKLGGLNEYGVAAYKVTDDIAQREVDYLLRDRRHRSAAGTASGPRLSLVAIAQRIRCGVPRRRSRRRQCARYRRAALAGVYDAIAYIETLRQARRPLPACPSAARSS